MATISKTQSEQEEEAWNKWRPSPEFWDELSKIHLEPSALKELDRRNQLLPPPSSPFTTGTTIPKDLARYARNGGPDLRWLRGNPPPTMMNLSRPSSPELVSPHNGNFEMHLIDHKVYTLYSSEEPKNLDEIMTAATTPHASLSGPDSFSNSDFQAFWRNYATAKGKTDVLFAQVPHIFGRDCEQRRMAMQTVFDNLEPLTDNTIVPAKPDVSYGAIPEQLKRCIRNALSRHIIPSTTEDAPMAPNFFMDVGSPYGAPTLAARKARYAGAIGSRAMHSLQNFGEQEPQYDGQAYAFTATYQSGLLTLYAHHMTSPARKGGAPSYHMTEVDSFIMKKNRAAFIEGAAAFRNLVDLARSHRDRFIQAANQRVQVQAELPVASSFVFKDAEEGYSDGSKRQRSVGEDGGLSPPSKSRVPPWSGRFRRLDST